MINVRRKGKVFERTVANMLKEWPGLEKARRGKPQTAGAIEPDVWAPWPFWVECKHGMGFSACAALAQAERDIVRADERMMTHPLLIARQTGGDMFFAVGAEAAKAVLQVEIIEGVLHDAKGYPVARLAPTKNWRTFLPSLRKTRIDGVGLVEESGHLFGWIGTLERLWRESK